MNSRITCKSAQIIENNFFRIFSVEGEKTVLKLKNDKEAGSLNISECIYMAEKEYLNLQPFSSSRGLAKQVGALLDIVIHVEDIGNPIFLTLIKESSESGFVDLAKHSNDSFRATFRG